MKFSFPFPKLKIDDSASKQLVTINDTVDRLKNIFKNENLRKNSLSFVRHGCYDGMNSFTFFSLFQLFHPSIMIV